MRMPGTNVRNLREQPLSQCLNKRTPERDLLEKFTHRNSFTGSGGGDAKPVGKVQPVVQGSDDVMEAVMGQMKACGIEFEVLCETEMIH